MTAVVHERCVACRKDSPRLSPAELATLRSQIADWNLVERDGIERLERVFTLPSFALAIDFVNRVAALAEQEDHHPVLLIDHRRVTVGWWTHAIGGLHRNDVIMAAKTDQLAG